MNFFKVIIALRSVGLSFTVIGELLKRLGEVLTGPNLEPVTPIQSGHEDQLQDPSNSIGEEGEEPEEAETGTNYEMDFRKSDSSR